MRAALVATTFGLGIAMTGFATVLWWAAQRGGDWTVEVNFNIFHEAMAESVGPHIGLALMLIIGAKLPRWLK